MEPTDLLEQAFLSQKNSKSKYSGFSVGCALLADDNEVILGCILNLQLILVQCVLRE
jgi:cytidine deaminase